MSIGKGLRIVVGAILFSVIAWGVLGAPGFLSDRDSTVPILSLREAMR